MLGVYRAGVAGRFGSGALVLLAALALSDVAAEAKVKIVEGQFKEVAAGEQGSRKLACPREMQVVSGGAFTGGSSLEDEVADSAPYDGKDDDKKPDDGWKASINAGAGSVEFQTWAICSDTLKLTYRSRPSEDALQGEFGTPPCPVGTLAVGGGMEVKGRSIDTPLKGSRPTQTGDAWSSYAFSPNFPPGLKGVAHSVCAKSDKIQYVNNSKMVPNQTQDDVEAQCPSGTKVIGGGGGGGNFDGVELASILPSDGSDDNSKPDDAWTTWSNNEDTGSAGQDAIGSVAVCLG